MTIERQKEILDFFILTHTQWVWLMTQEKIFCGHSHRYQWVVLEIVSCHDGKNGIYYTNNHKKENGKKIHKSDWHEKTKEKIIERKEQLRNKRKKKGK